MMRRGNQSFGVKRTKLIRELSQQKNVDDQIVEYIRVMGPVTPREVYYWFRYGRMVLNRLVEEGRLIELGRQHYGLPGDDRVFKY